MSGVLGSVLVTSAGAKVPLLRAAKAAASRLDPDALIIAGDLDPEAAAQFVADDFWPMPPLARLDHARLIAECLRRDIRTILPTRDGELAFWAEAKPRLAAEGIGVIVSSADSVALCTDKLALAQWGQAKALPFIPASLNAADFADSLLVVKARFGSGSRSIGIGLEQQEAVRHASSLADPLFQPFISGNEISIDAWLTSSGQVHGLVLRHRTRVVNGESQTTITFRDPAIEAQAQHSLSQLNLAGPVVMQAMMTANGLAIIEVNARFGGASTASINVGLDLLYWSFFERAFPDRPPPAFDRAAWDIRQVRIAQDIVIRDPDL